MIIEVELVEIDALDEVAERLRLEGGHVGVAEPPEKKSQKKQTLSGKPKGRKEDGETGEGEHGV